MRRWGGCILLFLFIFQSFFVQAETWHPFPMAWDQAPIRLSFLLDPPAGKHGFLGVEGDRFVFEDGVEIRFWGATLTGSGCFPSQDIAPMVAERLSQFGVNLVRFHQMDAEWATPNLFSMDPDAREYLNPEALDRLDFFLYQLEGRGIYAWMDGLSARRLREFDGIASWKYLPPGLKGYIFFDAGLQDVHQEFLQAFWSHRNRYTGRQYRDTPAIVMTELFHDNHLLLDRPRIQPFSTDFADQWKEHLRSQGAEDDLEFDWESPTLEMRRFASQLMGAASADFFHSLRAFSVKSPVTSSNAVLSLFDLPLASLLDFTHAEGLWNAPGLQTELFSNRRMTDVDLRQSDNLFSNLAFSRVEKKPFVVSKWGEPWPCDYRAEMPLWMAAMARFQNWRGAISSTCHSFYDPDLDSIAAPLESFNDPCVFGLMPAAALLFHRGGMQENRQKATMAVPDFLFEQDDPIAPSACRTTRLVDDRAVYVKLKSRASGKNIFLPTEPLDLDSYESRDNSAWHRRDAKRGLVFIDDSQTQAMIGRIKLAQFGELNYLDVESGEDFAVVSLNSLDGRPIPQSRDLWATVASQARNQGFQARQIDEETYRIEDRGRAPVLIRETPVRLFVKTNHEEWTVSVVDGGGEAGENLPYQIEEGRLSFRAGVHGTIYYRLSCRARDE
ncbi:MAG: hypothetical protein JXR73_09280 [Candidatus Omnitrophica bacterium]|nr:hypothetical protein [Candidatus Omnitrophota bacterium]